MPRTPGSSPFTGQSLKGMELDVKLEASGQYACLFAATAFDVQVAAATTSRQHTLNKGSRTSTGAAGEITATCDVFVVPDSPGQWAINRAFATGGKVNIRRCLFANQVVEEGGSSAGVDLAATSGKAVTIQIDPSPATAGDEVPKSGGLVTAADAADTPTGLLPLLAEAQPGMTLQIGTNNYFIGYKDIDGNLYISPSPTATSIAGYPYDGTAVQGVTGKTVAAGANTAPLDSGTVKLFTGRIQQTIYTGTVTVPVVATDAAPGDDGNDLSTAQISFALDDIGTPSYTFPS